MRATLVRALSDLPLQAAAIADVVDRNLLLEAIGVLKDHQSALASAFPQALLAEFAQAIAGDRVSSLSFDTLPLLGDEQLQENADLVHGAHALEEEVRPQLAALETALAAAQLTPQGGAHRHPLRPEVYARAVYRLARQSPISPAWRRRWLRHLPPLMAPELARFYAQAAQKLQPPPASQPMPLELSVPQEALDSATQLTIRELRKLLAG